jgi:hypothetical protein
MTLGNIKKIISMLLILALFLVIFYTSIIEFNEEVLFSVAFLFIVILMYRNIGEAVKVQLDNYSKEILLEFVKLGIDKAMILNLLSNLSDQIVNAGKEVNDIMLFLFFKLENLKNSFEKEFLTIYLLIKQSQLQMLVLEGNAFAKVVLFRRFSIYWKEIMVLLEESFQDREILIEHEGNRLDNFAIAEVEEVLFLDLIELESSDLYDYLILFNTLTNLD